MKRFALLMLALSLAACARAPQDAPPSAPSATAPAATSLHAATFGRYHWKLDRAVDAKGQRIEALFVRADAPVQLDFRDDRIGVSNACNRIGGRYTFEGGTLTVGDLASTQMACSDPKLMALDQAISQRLQGRQTVALQSGDTPTLTLTTQAGDALTFRGEPTADTRYGGPGETAFYEIAAHAKPCSHPLIPNKQCLQVREVHFDAQGLKTGTPGEWQPLYQDIEGFTHEDGVRNVVRVKRYAIKDPPADAPSQALVLDMVVESEIAKDAPRR